MKFKSVKIEHLEIVCSKYRVTIHSYYYFVASSRKEERCVEFTATYWNNCSVLYTLKETVTFQIGIACIKLRNVRDLAIADYVFSTFNILWRKSSALLTMSGTSGESCSLKSDLSVKNCKNWPSASHLWQEKVTQNVFQRGTYFTKTVLMRKFLWGRDYTLKICLRIYLSITNSD
jgi:hypothetical protein